MNDKTILVVDDEVDLLEMVARVMACRINSDWLIP